MAPFRTAFNGYAVKFSPFEEGRIAVATAQNFGIIGNGRQYVLQVQCICVHVLGPPDAAQLGASIAWVVIVITNELPVLAR